MITDVEGVRVGHWTDAEARTGCTVVLLPEGTVASGEVRGGAPATREFALLDPAMMVERLDAVVLTGGSAFGLAAADGVVDLLAERDVGFATAGGPVPIVVAMGLFDLAVGDGSVRPGPAEGRRAAEAASSDGPPLGRIGAATGATVAKWRGPEHRKPGGLVASSTRVGDVVVACLVAVNAYGEPGATSAEVIPSPDEPDPTSSFENTTIGVVVSNARLDKLGCHLVARSAHDGLARAVAPSHTAADGDAFVVATTGAVDAEVGAVRIMATHVVETAIAGLGSEPGSSASASGADPDRR